MRCATCPLILPCHTGVLHDDGWLCSGCGRTIWYPNGDQAIVWHCENALGKRSTEACLACDTNIRSWTLLPFDDLDEAAQDEAANQKGVFDL